MKNYTQNTSHLENSYYPQSVEKHLLDPDFSDTINSFSGKPESNASNKVDVKIMGQDYILQGDANSNYILSLVDYIELKMSELKKVCPNINDKKVAILTAINLCDELFQLKEQINKMPKVEDLERISSKTTSIISLLEHSIVGLFE